MARVFKFGGASVKDAAAVRNAVSILENHGKGNLVLIISAMGKTTNALERVWKSELAGNRTESLSHIEEIKKYHFDIAKDLFSNYNHKVFPVLNNRFNQLTAELDTLTGTTADESYDRLVQYGELLSTELIGEYIQHCRLSCTWLDVRELIITDNRFRDASIKWDTTQERINNSVIPLFDKSQHIMLTQGFIGGSSDGRPVTLGREGSDFSAAIFAYCLNAEEMVIWKDVPGLLNADPKLVNEAVHIEHISYREAVELAYYGATIIHPKTIKPLENKNIPLRIKSFMNPDAPGSIIDQHNQDDNRVPSFIFKFNQILLSISPRDFSFINEQNLHEIFGLFSKHNVKVCLMQNSAISFSLCTDNSEKIPALIEELRQNFKVRFNDQVELITIRHYLFNSAQPFLNGKKVLLEQKSRLTLQMVVKAED